MTNTRRHCIKLYSKHVHCTNNKTMFHNGEFHSRNLGNLENISHLKWGGNSDLK